jgi:hypothetical protein
MKRFISSQRIGNTLTKNQTSSFRLTSQLLSLVLAIFVIGTSWGQVSIFSNQINVNNPSDDNPFTSGQYVASNLIVSGIGYGPGVGQQDKNGSFAANEWTESNSIDLNEYFEWVITPMSCKEVSFGSLSLELYKNDKGPRNICLRSSTDNFSSNITVISHSTGTLNSQVLRVSGNAIDPFTLVFSLSSLQGLDSAVIFRLYGYDSEDDDDDSEFGVNSFDFTGSFSNILIASAGVNTTICLGSQVNFTPSVSGSGSDLLLIQDFDGTNTLNATYSSNGSLDGGEYAVSGDGLRVQQETVVLTTDNITSLSNFTNKQFQFRLASLSTNSTNGAEDSDSVTILISTDDGLSWSKELQITGIDNARWSYSSGNGIAAVNLDGDNAPTIFTPGGGGDRTTDGYSVVRLFLPNSVTQVRIRIALKNNNSKEIWAIDDLAFTGTAVNTYNWTSNPSGYTSSALNTIVVPNQTTTYTLSYSSGACTVSDEVVVTVADLVTAVVPDANDMIWTGKSSSAYETIENWLTFNGTSMVPATVSPSTLTNVIIPSVQTCVVNQPSIGANTVESKDITIEAGATLTMNNGTLEVGGNFTNNGTFVPGTGTVKMVGTATQDFIFGVGASHVFHNLIIDKEDGDEVVLNSHIDVTNEIYVTNKNLRLNSLNIDLGTTGVLKDEGPGHRIYCDCPVGYIQRTMVIPANTTVNPGNLGLTITAHANAMDTTVIRRRHLRAGSNGTTELVTGTPGIYRIFDVSPKFNGGTTYPLASGGLDVDLEFQYYIDEVGTDILAQEGEFGLWRSGDEGDTWEPKYGTVNTTTKTISLEGFKQFSWITGGPIENASALPIELVSFQANCTENNAISVTWTTASEHNTSHYVVEKSRDGITWSVLGQTAAAGNSTELLTYEMIDSEKANGTTYYRLTQYDNDGVFEQFDPVSVNCNGTITNNHITTYPNPSLDGFYVSLFTETMEGNGQLSIMDGSGRTVYSTSVNIQDGNNVFHIGDMNAVTGMYYIQVSNGTTTTHIVKHSLR